MMKQKYLLLFVLIFLICGSLSAQDTTQTKDQNPADTEKTKFVDLDGDGFNDYAPDHDGDGIPNGLDPDYQALRKHRGSEFVDLDGDGIDDRIFQEQHQLKKHGFGPQQTDKMTTGEPGPKKQTRRGKKN
jgi:hypothetical protein